MSDGYPCRYRRFQPTGEPRVEIMALHGIQSHGGWYVASCRMLAEAGFGVSFLDRRGSGLNPEDRGDCPSFRRLLDDVREFCRDGIRLPPARTVLLAISWGAKLAVGLQKRHLGLVGGMVLITPGFCPRVRPP